MKKILEIKNLSTYFFIEKNIGKAVNDVTYTLYEKEILGIVGESGSGKSVGALSILRLIPDPPGKIVSGQILFKAKDLLKTNLNDLRKIRGNEISMIFQEPSSALNPVFTVGDQVAESLIIHYGLSKKDAIHKTVDMFKKTGIPDAENKIKSYPHELSGGMCQRIMIAMALICNPSILIADEPTTALDVTIQAQILDLMLEIKNFREDSAIILITHDLAVVAETCSRVIVMYCGRVQEEASVEELFHNPKHPYTIALLESIPSLQSKKKRLNAIPGNVPDIMNFPMGCPFHPRCSKKKEICEKIVPEIVNISASHKVRCHFV
jgi:oligopeptide/dipeptide ABC transporter ATP-binding protein